MKRINFLLLIVIVFILSGCQSSKTLTFEGESDNWIANITAIQDGESETREAVLVYQGEEKQNVEGMEVNYKIEDHTGSRGGVAKLESPGLIQLKKYRNCSGCAFAHESMEIEFTVEWEGKTEIIHLKVL